MKLDYFSWYIENGLQTSKWFHTQEVNGSKLEQKYTFHGIYEHTRHEACLTNTFKNQGGGAVMLW